MIQERISLKAFTLNNAIYLKNENLYCSEIGNKTPSICIMIYTFPYLSNSKSHAPMGINHKSFKYVIAHGSLNKYNCS